MTTGQETVIRRTRRWLETIAITLSGPAVGMAFHAKDPFWMYAPIPWLLMVPLLSGAQYGLIHAAFSSVLLSGLAYAYGTTTGTLDLVVLSSWGLGGLIFGTITGQFRDVREERLLRASALVAHLSERVERSERAGRLLKLSHERLEERLAATRWSLGGSVEQAQRSMLELCSRRELGEALLNVLATQAMVQSASLYWAGSGAPLPFAVATLGSPVPGSNLHPLVMRAWKTRRLAAVGDVNAALAADDGTVLAAAPVITSSGHIVGVVAIHQMPFMSFQAEQLRALLIMVGQLGDTMNDRLRALAQQNIVSPRSAVEPVLVPPPPLGTSEVEPDAELGAPGVPSVGRVRAAST